MAALKFDSLTCLFPVQAVQRLYSESWRVCFSILLSFVFMDFCRCQSLSNDSIDMAANTSDSQSCSHLMRAWHCNDKLASAMDRADARDNKGAV